MGEGVLAGDEEDDRQEHVVPEVGVDEGGLVVDHDQQPHAEQEGPDQLAPQHLPQREVDRVRQREVCHRRVRCLTLYVPIAAPPIAPPSCAPMYTAPVTASNRARLFPSITLTVISGFPCPPVSCPLSTSPRNIASEMNALCPPFGTVCPPGPVVK